MLCLSGLCPLQHPWSEFDNEVSIMFRVGFGGRPPNPDRLSEEGVDFLSKCFVANPAERATASSLIHHLFVRYSDSL